MAFSLGVSIGFEDCPHSNEWVQGETRMRGPSHLPPSPRRGFAKNCSPENRFCPRPCSPPRRPGGGSAAQADIDDPARVAEALGLTRAESVVAVLLAQGKTIDDVAAETGTSRSTVKWHIRHSI